MYRFLVRDLVITAVWLGLLALDASMRGSGSALSIAVALSTGALAAIVGFLMHEWGHLVGALVTKSLVYFPERITSVFLFHFDTRSNDRKQFLAMSVGGFIASFVGVLVIAALLPLDALSGQTSLALVSLGVLATVVLELPTYLRVLRGGALPGGSVYQPFEGTEQR